LKPFGKPLYFGKLPTRIEPTFFDYNQALKVAKENNRLLLVNFTGHGCVGDSRQLYWPTEYFSSREFIEGKMVYCLLYVDEKVIVADSSKWYRSSSGRLNKSIGSINNKIQADKFDSNAQPMYAIIDPKQDTAVSIFGYSSPNGKTLNLMKGYYSF
jgi:thiol:disulfide interchange protein DsbD